MRFRTWVAAAAAIVCNSASGAPSDLKTLGAPTTRAAAAPELAASESVVRRMTLRELTGQASITLRGTDGAATVALGGRADEFITRVTLNIRFTVSPAIIVNQSHLKVLMNGETVGVIALTKEGVGRSTTRAIEVEPSTLTDFNRLTFQFIGHYAAECEDQLHSSLWTEISGASEIAVFARPLAGADDLALLPEPFFDRRDLRRLRVPFLLPAQPSLEVIRSAGIVASWLGQHAQWRGTRFPVSLDTRVSGHAVVVAADDDRPALIAMLPRVTGPTIGIITNPTDGVSKLLLIRGRNGDDLRIAVEALVLGHVVLSGPTAKIAGLVPPAPRRAYDAPNWVRTDRPTRLAELVERTVALQVHGHTPDWIRVPLRVPPDLFIWRSRGVPMHIGYRHNAPKARGADGSRLTVNINGELLRSFDLATSDSSQIERMRVALLGGPNAGAETRIPAITLAGRNELQLGFAFAVPRDGACRDSFIHNIGGVIDPDSTLDFSGFAHYATMPQVGSFASLGFPFTKFADLAQTVVVLPKHAGAATIEVFLGLMGRAGESTGYPAVGVRVTGPDERAAWTNADLLLIGAAPMLEPLALWRDRVPVVLDGAQRHLSVRTHQDGWLRSAPIAPGSESSEKGLQASVESDGSVAAIVGFESPLTASRSVVAVTATAEKDLLLVLDALADTGRVAAMHGGAALVHPNRVESYPPERIYRIGALPPWTWIWHHAASYPLLAVCAALLAAIAFGVLARRALRRIAARRMRRSAGGSR